MSIIFNLSSACTDLYWREAEAFVERSKDRHGNAEEEPEPAKGLASQWWDVLSPLQPTDVHCTVTREHCPRLQKDLKRMEWQYLELSWMILCLSKLRSTTGSRTSQKRQAKQWRRLCSIMGGRSEVQWVVAGMAVWMHIICSLFQLLILAAADFRWQNWFWRLVRDKISRNLSDYYFGQSCKLYIYIYIIIY